MIFAIGIDANRPQQRWILDQYPGDNGVGSRSRGDRFVEVTGNSTKGPWE
jgi:hypothetical protein